MTDSIVSTLRAMARNYAGGHSWDHLDGEAVSQAADEIERLRVVIEQQKSLIESLRAELVESYSTDASAEPSAPVEHDHDALVAAACVLRSQGLRNLSEAVEAARAALERKLQVKS
ncbi:hypothetical protein ACLEJW_09015 [Pseudomonas sp. SMSB3]|uniref:hypothetical protein n=1 Tax=Pseudomonas sp. SMSB3 TaxID=3390196 RepID=UPI003F8785A0